MSSIYRISVAEWRRKYYATLKGVPSVAAIKAGIDNNEILGNSIAGKYHVCCDHKYEPRWDLLKEKTVQKPKHQVTSALAAKILKEEGYA